MDENEVEINERPPQGATPLQKPEPETTNPGTTNAEITHLGKRRRGRPAKDPSGDRFLDRRRARVREATRALRQRKEASVQALQSRNVVLEATVEKMSSMFIDFSDAVLQSQAILKEVELTRRLKLITEDFLSLAQNMIESNTNGPEGPMTSQDVHDKAADPITAAQIFDLPPSSSQSTQSSTHSSETRQNGQEHLPQPGSLYQASTSPTSNFLNMPKAYTKNKFLQRYATTPSPLNQRALITQLDLNPATNSDSVPFDQLLLRSCLSLALDALCGASATSLSLAKSMFRFSLLHRSISDLLASIRWSLLIGFAQDIELMREEPVTNLVEEIAFTLFLRGGSQSDYVNYEEVEDYLRRKGAFYIDGKMVKMLKQYSPDSVTQRREFDSGFNSEISMTGSPSDRMESVSPQEISRSLFADRAMEPLFVEATLESSPKLSSPSFDSWQSTEDLQALNLEVVTLNMHSLMQNLAVVSICLGRGPAFLPANLDQAIEASRVETVF